jgi:Flp pilus assembly protein TadG
MHITRFTTRTRHLVRQLHRDTSGNAMIEMAYVLPILVTLGGFGLEMANLANVSHKISQAAMALGDNMSRVGESSNLAATQIREADVVDSFIGIKRQTGEIDLGTRGRVVLSSLQQNADGGQHIKWQRCMGTKLQAGSYGGQGTGATGTAFLGMGPATARITAPDDSAVMHVEIFYDYRPLFTTMFIPARTIRYEASYIVRDSRDLVGPVNGDGVYNPAPVATKYTCNINNAGPAVPV